MISDYFGWKQTVPFDSKKRVENLYQLLDRGFRRDAPTIAWHGCALGTRHDRAIQSMATGAGGRSLLLPRRMRGRTKVLAYRMPTTCCRRLIAGDYL